MTKDFLDALHIVQIIVLAVVTSTLILIVLGMILDKKNALKDMGFLFWTIHGLIFYTVLVSMPQQQALAIQNGPFFTGWSTALRLHGYATLLVVAIDHILHELHKRGIFITSQIKKFFRRKK